MRKLPLAFLSASALQHCPSTRNPSAPDRAISGLRVTGPTITTTRTISGFLGRGCSLLSQASFGPQVTGVGAEVSTFGTPAIGDQESASTAELTMALATPALASSAATGAAAITTTTALSPTST